MKSVLKFFRELLVDFNTRVEEAILKGEFEKLEEDKHVITIKVLGKIVEVWHFRKTYISRVRLGEFHESVKFNDKTGELKNPEECMKILMSTKIDN